MITPALPETADPPLRVMSLHALLYCERLFYLEEVEEIRVADANVFAGRRLHVERLPLDDETPELRSFEVSSDLRPAGRTGGAAAGKVVVRSARTLRPVPHSMSRPTQLTLRLPAGQKVQPSPGLVRRCVLWSGSVPNVGV